MTDLEFYTNWYLEDADHGYWTWPKEVITTFGTKKKR